jgi:pyruvate dehydrogenase E1 component beta subunit
MHEVTYREAVREALAEEMERDPLVFMLGENLVGRGGVYEVTKGLLKTSIRDDDPVIFLEHRMLYAMKGEIPDGDYTLPLGMADIKRPGKDVTVVATALMVHKALEAAAELERDGIDLEVIDPRSLLPMDWETITTSIEKTGRLLVAHEACRTGGIGAEIAATAAEKAFGYLDAPVVRVCAPDVPVPFSPPLEQAYIPKTRDIVAAVKRMIG